MMGRGSFNKKNKNRCVYIDMILYPLLSQTIVSVKMSDLSSTKRVYQRRQKIHYQLKMTP